MFLSINGFSLKAEPAEAVNTMLALAAGHLAERGGLGEGLSPGVSPGVYKPRALPHEPSLQEAELELANWIEKSIF